MSSEAKRAALLAHARTATLLAALVPLGQLAGAPMVASLEASCATCNTVPEPATLLLLAPAAVMLLSRRRR